MEDFCFVLCLSKKNNNNNTNILFISQKKYLTTMDIFLFLRENCSATELFEIRENCSHLQLKFPSLSA